MKFSFFGVTSFCMAPMHAVSHIVTGGHSFPPIGSLLKGKPKISSFPISNVNSAPLPLVYIGRIRTKHNPMPTEHKP